MTVEVFGKITWCLIPEDAVFGSVILGVPDAFFAFVGLGLMLETTILSCCFLASCMILIAMRFWKNAELVE